MSYFFIFFILSVAVSFFCYSEKNTAKTEKFSIENITLDDVHIEAKKAVKISQSSNWEFKKKSVKTNNGSKSKIENSTNVIFPETIWE